jgi:hypothetical protein
VRPGRARFSESHGALSSVRHWHGPGAPPAPGYEESIKRMCKYCDIQKSSSEGTSALAGR